MAHGDSDSRNGSGKVTDVIELPTHLIDCNLCTWTVVRSAPGLGCISRLRYASALCRRCARGEAKIPVPRRAAA
jgi:hypothetical protein